MALREADGNMRIQKGHFVYWMDSDKEIPRGDLGWVSLTRGYDGDIGVLFPGPDGIRPHPWQGDLSHEHLYKSWFQKMMWVHVADVPGVSFSDIGYVYEYGGGDVQVTMKEALIQAPPEAIHRCDFQHRSWVHILDHPESELVSFVGTYMKSGKIVAYSPSGRCAEYEPWQLALARVQEKSWVLSDQGEVGVAKDEEKGKILVRFPSSGKEDAPREETFMPKELKLSPIQPKMFVTWTGHDEDVPEGHVGEVYDLKMKTARINVRFPKGDWDFKVTELVPHRLQPGKYVWWKSSDEDIPKGHIGEVIKLKKDQIAVQWPKSWWSMKPDRLLLLPFQRGDRVTWKHESADIPKGTIGTVISICYHRKGGDDGAGTSLFVYWPGFGRLVMRPDSLRSANWNTQSINRLKATFGRFDRNGDGKISEEELVSVMSSLGDLSESECRELFKSLDKDGNGKLSVAEFVDYVFADEDRYAGEGLAKQLGMEKPPTPVSKPKDEAPPDEGSGGFMSQVGSFFGF
ncbi:unnamed protein product [Symbiodinium natans]|uniref:EF-hand domain-containing protein n=1 Tax=Symbiodinium natans TaxID=878477 RepID=A0A812TA24_9DINO|nr:unnamed protein product [Symbiodinium natans]